MRRCDGATARRTAWRGAPHRAALRTPARAWHARPRIAARPGRRRTGCNAGRSAGTGRQRGAGRVPGLRREGRTRPLWLRHPAAGIARTKRACGCGGSHPAARARAAAALRQGAGRRNLRQRQRGGGGGDEPYPRHWSQRLGLLRSRPDPIGRASMRGGPSPSIVGDAPRRAQRSCRSSAAKRRPSGSISSSLSPDSTTPAKVAQTPFACAISTVRCACPAGTKSAKPAPMFSVP